MRAFAIRRTLLGSSLAVLAATAAACGSDSINGVTPVATVLAENAGVDAQTGAAGTTLAKPISVHLTDQSSAAMPGVIITWTVHAGGGTVDSTTSTTDANGDAVVHWTLGTTVGADTLLATTSNGVTSIIGATAVAGPAATVAIVSGDAQAVAAGAAAVPCVVKVTDPYGNVVAGVAVAWTVTGGGTLSSASTTTDATGLAQVTLTTSATPGTYTVTGTATGLAPVNFTVTGS